MEIKGKAIKGSIKFGWSDYNMLVVKKSESAR